MRYKDWATIAVPSDPKYLCAVRDLSSRMSNISGLDEAEADRVKLAVDEACSNIIKHAYGGDTGKKIVVKFNISRTGLEVIIEDTGEKADVESIKGRDLDDVRPGGLGVHFMRRVFDVLEFDRQKKNGNRLRLIKYIRKPDEDRDKPS